MLSWLVYFDPIPKRAGGTSGDQGESISALSDGAVLVTGRFGGYYGETATFGPGEIGEIVLSSDGADDIFVAKYNPDGSLAWAKRAGGTTSSDTGHSISALSDGSALVTGHFGGTATFGPGETNETVLSPSGMFMAKYNPDGTLAWAKGTEGGTGSGISALSDGSALVTGYFYSDTATFGPGEANETILSPSGMFIAKYNPDGTLAWAKGAEGGSGSGISALSDGTALVTGQFGDTTTFGLDETNETVLVAYGGDNIFVAKYNPDGTLAWAKSAGGNDYDNGGGISALSDGSALVTGRFCFSYGDTATFGPGEINETVLESDGQADIFVAKFGP